MTTCDFIINVNENLSGRFHAHSFVQRKHCRCGFEYDDFVNIVRIDERGQEYPFVMFSTETIKAFDWQVFSNIFELLKGK